MRGALIKTSDGIEKGIIDFLQTAMDFDELKRVSVVNEVLCRGCGNCVASCPSGAASLKHFTTTQLHQEVVEALR